MVAFSRFQYTVGMMALSCVLHAQAMKGKTSNLQSHRELGVYISNIWPKGVVCYDIPNGIASAREQSLNTAIDLYREKLGIEFIKINECSDKYGSSSVVCGGCTAKVAVVDNEPGCFATMGYTKGGGKLNCQFDGVGPFLHEMGHVLGRMHEQNHPDRKAIPVLENIPSEKQGDYAKKEDISAAQLEPYDYKSIMHYGRGYYCMPKDLSVKYCDVGESGGCVKPTKDDCDPSIPVGFDGKNPTFSEGDIVTFKKMYSGELDGSDSKNTNVTSAPTTGAPSMDPETTIKPSKTPDTTGEPSKTPETTIKPSKTPDTTGEPSKTPETTRKPCKPGKDGNTKTPETTIKPSKTPDTTGEPSMDPETTKKPSKTPDTTGGPSKTPDTTGRPSMDPESTKKPSKTPEMTRKPCKRGSDDNTNKRGSDDNINKRGSDDNTNKRGSDDNTNKRGSDDDTNQRGSDDNTNQRGSDDNTKSSKKE